MIERVGEPFEAFYTETRSNLLCRSTVTHSFPSPEPFSFLFHPRRRHTWLSFLQSISFEIRFTTLAAHCALHSINGAKVREPRQMADEKVYAYARQSTHFPASSKVHPLKLRNHNCLVFLTCSMFVAAGSTHIRAVS